MLAAIAFALNGQRLLVIANGFLGAPQITGEPTEIRECGPLPIAVADGARPSP